MSSTSTMNMISVKGAVPRNMSPSEMPGSFNVLLITNTESPNGGVSRPISTATTVTTPNHTRFMPNFSAIGNISGNTISMIEEESMMVPSAMMIATYSARKAPGPSPARAIDSTSSCGMPDIASIRV